MTKAINRFERGAIAFLKRSDELQACYVWSCKPIEQNTWEYRISFNGLSFWVPDSKLLSGWEEDFVNHGPIDWGNVEPSAVEDYEGRPPEGEVSPEKAFLFTEDWQPNDDYYSERAEEYEAVQLSLF